MTATNLPDDTELVERAQKGDKDAFG